MYCVFFSLLVSGSSTYCWRYSGSSHATTRSKMPISSLYQPRAFDLFSFGTCHEFGQPSVSNLINSVACLQHYILCPIIL